MRGMGRGRFGTFECILLGGWNNLVTSRTVAERLFGVFFASAQLLLRRPQIITFLQLKVGSAREEGRGWWGSLLDWIDRVEWKVFLMRNVVLHAAWEKPLFVQTKAAPSHAYKPTQLLVPCLGT